MPLVPVNDGGTWNPYQTAQITVSNSAGTILAQTRAMVPTSDEINCARCHGANAFLDVLQVHDADNGTTLVADAPVLCASCHGSPALGSAPGDTGSSGRYLSDVMHDQHKDKGAACYDCHPGSQTKCSRSLAHTAADGNCIACHGTLAQMAALIQSGDKIPWVDEPQCVTCHQVSGVSTGTELYRNSTGHGGVYCEGCHQSPHAMVPSREAGDNYQALQYMGAAVSLGSCGACHDSSRGDEEIDEFGEEHGGTNPERETACHVCHTAVSTDTADWPHAFGWTAR